MRLAVALLLAGTVASADPLGVMTTDRIPANLKPMMQPLALTDSYAVVGPQLAFVFDSRDSEGRYCTTAQGPIVAVLIHQLGAIESYNYAFAPVNSILAIETHRDDLLGAYVRNSMTPISRAEVDASYDALLATMTVPTDITQDQIDGGYAFLASAEFAEDVAAAVLRDMPPVDRCPFGLVAP